MNYQTAGERHGLSENQGAPWGFPPGGGFPRVRVGVYQNRSLMRARSRLEKVGIDGLLLALRGAHDGDTTRYDDTAGGDPILPTMDPASLRPSLRLWAANARTHRTTEPPTGQLNPFNSVQENREPNPPGSAPLGYCRPSGSCTAILPTGRQNLNKPYHSPGAADLDGLGRVRAKVLGFGQFRPGCGAVGPQEYAKPQRPSTLEETGTPAAGIRVIRYKLDYPGSLAWGKKTPLSAAKGRFRPAERGLFAHKHRAAPEEKRVIRCGGAQRPSRRSPRRRNGGACRHTSDCRGRT